MTNIFGSPEKAERRDRLFEIAVETLERYGWKVERIERSGKAGVRRITKGGKSLVAAIRTTQDRWISFARTRDDKRWLTLSDVEVVVAASVDDKHNPKEAWVHIFKQPDIVARFDRAYVARMAASFSIPVGRGVWLSLYDKEAKDPVTLVGAGAGLDTPAIEKVLLDGAVPSLEPPPVISASPPSGPRGLTLAEAKQGLAITFNVDPSAIKITIEG